MNVEKDFAFQFEVNAYLIVKKCHALPEHWKRIKELWFFLAPKLPTTFNVLASSASIPNTVRSLAGSGVLCPSRSHAVGAAPF